MTIINHPSSRFKMCVHVSGVGVVFVGNRDDCNTYIFENSWKYRELTKVATV